MSLRDVLEIVSSLALVASVLVLAWQSRQLAQATRLATRTAVAGAMSDAATNLRAVFDALLTYPELRPYICDGVPLPAAGIEHSRAQTMCEMMCDAVEASLEVGETIPGAGFALSGWPDWARWVLASSPGSAAHVATNPTWYPRLTALAT